MEKVKELLSNALSIVFLYVFLVLLVLGAVAVVQILLEGGTGEASEFWFYNAKHLFGLLK
jgi:hypothetical protein